MRDKGLKNIAVFRRVFFEEVEEGVNNKGHIVVVFFVIFGGRCVFVENIINPALNGVIFSVWT